MTAPPPARLAAAEAERLPEEIERAIWGLVRSSVTLGRSMAPLLPEPGLLNGHANTRAALTATIFSRLTAAEAARDAAVARAERLEGATKVAQSALAMLTEPREIRSTSVANAWAVAVDAELKCRQALAAVGEKTDG